MPCRYDDDVPNEIHELRVKLDKLTNMLCSVLTILTSRGDTYWLRGEVREWWAKHQAADRAREEKERTQKQEANDRAVALAKLSEHERNLLGIK